MKTPTLKKGRGFINSVAVESNSDTKKLQSPTLTTKFQRSTCVARINLATHDGRVFGTLARSRRTPAHSAIHAVFNGLLKFHQPFFSTEFQKEFYKNVGGDHDLK